MRENKQNMNKVHELVKRPQKDQNRKHFSRPEQTDPDKTIQNHKPFCPLLSGRDYCYSFLNILLYGRADKEDEIKWAELEIDENLGDGAIETCTGTVS